MSQKQQLGASGYFSRPMVSLVVGVLYVAACVCPAVKVPDPVPIGLVLWAASGGLLRVEFQDSKMIDVLGVQALRYGAQDWLLIPWSANVLLLIGWVLLLCRKYTVALGFGAAAVLAGLTTWAFFQAAELLPGYYLWQASLLAFALGTLAVRSRAERAAAADRGRSAAPAKLTV